MIWHNSTIIGLETRTYTLPPDLLLKFEQRLPPGERSSSLARIMEAWLADREREELRQLVVEGCHAMKDDYEEIEREWAPAADQVWRDNG